MASDLSQSLNIQQEIESPSRPPQHRKGKKLSEKKIVYPSIFPFLLISMLLVMYILLHSYAATLPVLKSFATNSVDQYYTTQVQQQLKQQYPTATPQELQSLIKIELRKILSSTDAKESYRQVYQKFLDAYTDEEGQPYLYSPDGYLFLKQAENLVKIKSLCPLKEGEPFDSHRKAPLGQYCTDTLLPHLIEKLYHFGAYFGLENIEQAAAFLSVVLGGISLVLIFLIGYFFYGMWAGFFSGLIFIFSSELFTVFRYGFGDTNPLNLFLSVAIVFTYLIFIQTLKQEYYHSFSFYISLIVLFGFGYLFRYAWPGYIYIYIIIFIHFLYSSVHGRTVPSIGIAAAFCIAGLLFIWKNNILNSILSRLTGKISTDILSVSILSINELQSTGLLGFIHRIGGWVSLIFLLFGIYFLYIEIFKNRKNHYPLSFLLIWFFCLVIPAYLADRFLSYLLLPITFILGYALQTILHLLHEKEYLTLFSLISANRIRQLLAVFFLCCVLIVSLYPSLFGMVTQLPIVDDAIAQAAYHIKYSTSPTTIINTWWDDGYYYQYFADRGTLFDGAIFDGFVMHYLALAFTATNESQAMHYLKIINCGGEELYTHGVNFNDSLETLEAYFLEENYSTREHLLREAYFTTPLNKEQEFTTLLHFAESRVQCVPNTQIALSDGFIGKYPTLKQITSEKQSLPQQPSFYITDEQSCIRQNLIIYCPQIKVDLEARTAWFDGSVGPFLYFNPQKGVLLGSVDTIKRPYTLVVREDGKITVRLIRTDIINELYIRLYFFDGYGLSHFNETFSYANPVTQTVKVFDVNFS